MSDAIEEKRPKGFWAGVIFICVEILLILVFVPNSWIESSRDREAGWMVTLMGEEGATDVYYRAQSWYEVLVVDSGVGEAIHYFFVPTEEEQARSRGLESLGELWITFIESRGEALANVVGVMLARVSHIALWMPFMAALLIPAVLDGYMAWKIKRTNFDYSSPFLNRYGHLVASAGLMLMLVGLIFPGPVPPLVIPAMSLLLIPIVGICVIGNLPKRI